jgi:hypothetical protein
MSNQGVTQIISIFSQNTISKLSYVFGGKKLLNAFNVLTSSGYSLKEITAT